MPRIADLTTGVSAALERELRALRDDWAIRKSVAQNYGQLLQELASLARPPAAVIVPGSGNFPQDGLSAELSVAVILIDCFTASQPGRVAGVQQLLDRTIEYFHPVRDLGEHGYARPGRFYPVEVDEQYAALALELSVYVPFDTEWNCEKQQEVCAKWQAEF